jgi:hypothetical protein
VLRKRASINFFFFYIQLFFDDDAASAAANKNSSSRKKGILPLFGFYKRLGTTHLLTLLRRGGGEKKLWLHKRGGV